MRPACAVQSALALALAAAVARADDTTTTTTLPPPRVVEQTTEVHGTVPDLRGRWLVLAQLGLSGEGAKRTIPSVWDVTQGENGLEIHERLVVLPEVQAKAIERSNEEMRVTWSPTPADIDAIAAAWDTLTPEPRGVMKMTHEITGRDAFDENYQKEPVTADAQWAVRQLYLFEPGGGHPINQGNVLGATKELGGEWSGKYVAVAIAAAPFPIPIKFDGTFRLIPIPAASRSWWARIGDFFAGCSGRGLPSR